VISGPGWSTDLYGLLTGIGLLGSKLHEFTDAVGLGSASHVVGKTFVTVDVGTVPGAGVGTGTGITGLSASTISSTIYSMAVLSFGQAGSRLKDTCDQIAAACVAQMALATLATVDSPVYLGGGTITPGTIAVIPAVWGATIQSQAPNFLGSQWPNFAAAIGTGMGENVQSSGTGSLVIVGSPSGAPVPGGGAGGGTIS
jgi:hypothetical protein